MLYYEGFIKVLFNVDTESKKLYCLVMNITLSQVIAMLNARYDEKKASMTQVWESSRSGASTEQTNFLRFVNDISLFKAEAEKTLQGLKGLLPRYVTSGSWARVFYNDAYYSYPPAVPSSFDRSYRGKSVSLDMSVEFHQRDNQGQGKAWLSYKMYNRVPFSGKLKTIIEAWEAHLENYYAADKILRAIMEKRKSVEQDANIILFQLSNTPEDVERVKVMVEEIVG